jgi:hypothetical protein
MDNWKITDGKMESKTPHSTLSSQEMLDLQDASYEQWLYEQWLYDELITPPPDPIAVAILALGLLVIFLVALFNLHP